MARSSSFTYDPSTGTWTNSVSNTTSTSSSSALSSKEDNLTATSSDSQSAVGEAEKEYNDIEYNTLVGTLNFIANTETIQLKAGDTVELKGLGKYLSGTYFVQDITRTISNQGYVHSATVIKPNFGNSLKLSIAPPEIEEQAVPSTPTGQTYTVSKGDCLWVIAKQFYGDGRDYTKIYDANTNQVVDPDLIYPGQVLVIP